MFVRGKAKGGQDAVRHSQADFEARLPVAERTDIQHSVKRGISDIEAGRFEDYDAEGLRGLAQKLFTRSAQKQASRAKA